MKSTKEQRDADKKYKHSVNALNVYNDVEALFNLFKENPTYKDEIINLLRPYISNSLFWKFVLHTTADNPKLHKGIKELLIKSKD